ALRRGRTGSSRPARSNPVSERSYAPRSLLWEYAFYAEQEPVHSISLIAKPALFGRSDAGRIGRVLVLRIEPRKQRVSPLRASIPIVLLHKSAQRSERESCARETDGNNANLEWGRKAR